MVAHFESVANAVSIPVILYNVPSRTISALTVETIKTLSQKRNIIGIKEASGNIEFAKEIITACGPNFLMLSGDDGTYAEFLKAGGHGVISVASHIIPKAFKKILEKKGDDPTYANYLPFINLLFCEANPIPVKKALQMAGIIASAELRLPLVELESNNSSALQLEMKKVGLL
jgi:4-hydroxy-tetrahydrodipicolinate synthase